MMWLEVCCCGGVGVLELVCWCWYGFRLGFGQLLCCCGGVITILKKTPCIAGNYPKPVLKIGLLRCGSMSVCADLGRSRMEALPSVSQRRASGGHGEEIWLPVQ